MTNSFSYTFLRRLTWVIVWGGLFLLFLQPWKPRNPALEQIKDQWMMAHQTKNMAAMEALFYGDKLDEEMRSRWRTVILQEFDLPLRSVSVKPLSDGTIFPPHTDSAFTPVAQMTITYADPNHFTVTYYIGKNPSGVHRILLFNP